MKFLSKEEVLNFLIKNPARTAIDMSNALRAEFKNDHRVTELGQSTDGNGIHVQKITDHNDQVILPGVDSCLAVISLTDKGNKVITHIGQFDWMLRDISCRASVDDSDNAPMMEASLQYGFAQINKELNADERIISFECIGNREWEQPFKDAITAYNSANPTSQVVNKVRFVDEKKSFDLLVSKSGNIMLKKIDVEKIANSKSFVNKIQSQRSSGSERTP